MFFFLFFLFRYILPRENNSCIFTKDVIIPGRQPQMQKALLIQNHSHKKKRKKERRRRRKGKASALRCVLFQTLEKRNTHYSLLTPSVFSGWTETTHIPTNKHHGEPARRENQHEKKHNVHGCKGKEQEREEAAKVRKAKAEETKEWRIPTTT